MRISSAASQVAALAVSTLLVLGSSGVQAQDRPYTEGTVWTVTMIRVKPGMFDVYMRDLLPMRQKMVEESKKLGLLLSTHILAGSSNGRDDFDLMILEEYKNWAAFDGMSAKMDAIMRNVIGAEDKQVQVMTKRTEVREIVGEKTMQEVVPK